MINEMGDDVTAFMQTLETVYLQVMATRPKTQRAAQDQLVQGLAQYGYVLVTDLLQALGFAAVNCR
ncbi:MAG TPA: hypothetical protein VLW50_23970 [Streptosporangiaceae bacterium]|nr:hypothetical protein [Streptosporangiaceae bacterium]